MSMETGCVICGDSRGVFQSVCSNCRLKIKLADAVLNMPEGSELIRCKRSYIVHSSLKPWALELFDEDNSGNCNKNQNGHGSGWTSIEALEDAEIV